MVLQAYVEFPFVVFCGITQTYQGFVGTGEGLVLQNVIGGLFNQVVSIGQDDFKTLNGIQNEFGLCRMRVGFVAFAVETAVEVIDVDAMNVLIQVDDGLVDEMSVIIVYAEGGFSAWHIKTLHKADASVVGFFRKQSFVEVGLVALGIIKDKDLLIIGKR